MKIYSLVFILLLNVATAFAGLEEWLVYSSPFPVHDAIPHWGGALLATSGGIRYRTIDGDYVFHSENGLETSDYRAVVKSPLGIFAVSEFGVVAQMNDDGKRWSVLNRSYVKNNARVIPGMVRNAEGVLVIGFESRLAFFDLFTSSSLLTVDRIGSHSLTVNTITQMTIRGDSLYIRIGDASYVRYMDWKNVATDVRLSDPESWIEVSDWRTVDGLDVVDSMHVVVEDDTLTEDFLYEVKVRHKKIVEKDSTWDSSYTENVSRIKWYIPTQDGYLLVGPREIYYYDSKITGSFKDLSKNDVFKLGEPYELKTMPMGGVMALSVDGGFSYTDSKIWAEPKYPNDGVGSFMSAYSSRMKVVSVLPDGYVFMHLWGLGYFIYSQWGERWEHSYYPVDGYCFDNFLETPPYSIAVASTPAPDNSGFLTATGNNDGYSLVYFSKNGDVSCAKQIGSASIGGPIQARLAEDGSWIVYVGTRKGTSLADEGDLDVITLPSPKSNGGELGKAKVKTYRGISPSPIDMVYDTIDNRLWLQSMSMIAYYDEENDTLVAPKSTRGLRGAEYTSMDIDVHGNLWVGTANQGAFRLTRKGKSADTLTAMHFDARGGLMSDNVSDIAIDPTLGIAWFAHEHGVTQYRRKDLRYTGLNMTDSAKADVRAYPIPFRPKEHRFLIIENFTEDAVVSIYNRGGALMRSFSGEDVLGGRIEWDGTQKNGKLVAPGVYYYVINAGSKKKKGKFIIIH